MKKGDKSRKQFILEAKEKQNRESCDFRRKKTVKLECQLSDMLWQIFALKKKITYF